jgi:hypothetical protein
MIHSHSNHFYYSDIDTFNIYILIRLNCILTSKILFHYFIHIRYQCYYDLNFDNSYNIGSDFDVLFYFPQNDVKVSVAPFYHIDPPVCKNLILNLRHGVIKFI